MCSVLTIDFKYDVNILSSYFTIAYDILKTLQRTTENRIRKKNNPLGILTYDRVDRNKLSFRNTQSYEYEPGL